MAWRPHGRAIINSQSPEAMGVCDRCGFLYRLTDLQFQFEWRGTQLMNTGLRVCTVTCYDKPFIFNRPIILPPDPVPVYQPRPENYAAADEGGTPGPVNVDTQFGLDEDGLDEGPVGPHL